MARRVVLVHGLWMRAPVLGYWAAGLRAAGFDPVPFSYDTLRHAPEAAMPPLRALVMRDPDSHVLAHSLGGLVAVKALADAPGYRGHIVCVGSPLAGTRVLRRLAGTRLATIAGGSLDLLCNGLDAVPAGLSVSVIAGVRPFGLGRVLHRFSEPNDGSVALSETRIPGLQQHITVNASHSGQLFSKQVLDAAIAVMSGSPRAGA